MVVFSLKKKKKGRGKEKNKPGEREILKRMGPDEDPGRKEELDISILSDEGKKGGEVAPNSLTKKEKTGRKGGIRGGVARRHTTPVTQEEKEKTRNFGHIKGKEG